MKSVPWTWDAVTVKPSLRKTTSYHWIDRNKQGAAVHSTKGSSLYKRICSSIPLKDEGKGFDLQKLHVQLLEEVLLLL